MLGRTQQRYAALGAVEALVDKRTRGYHRLSDDQLSSATRRRSDATIAMTQCVITLTSRTYASLS